MGYDTDYRLKSEAITADSSGKNGTVSYVYDVVGNRALMTSTLNAVPGGSFFFDANDRLTTDTYDNDGNTISSAGTANTYDFENRMLTHGGVALVYDGDGNRVAETIGGTTTKFLVDDKTPTGLPQVLDEIVSGSVNRTYAYGLQRISENQLISGTWTPSFYGYDGHGNARSLVSAAASVTDSYDYDAFGMPIRTSGTTPNQFLYSDERYDSNIGLYDLRARYYNQATGRFWARDPAEGVMCTPDTFNPYIYALNEPTDNIDPTGQEAATETLTLDWKTILTIPGQIALAIAKACAASEVATGFGSIFYNGITGNNPLNLQQAAPCVIKPKPRTCKPCSPPAGTIGYRFDQGPPAGHTHFPSFCCHYNYCRVNQNPTTCQCFWNPFDRGLPTGNRWITPFGAVPIPSGTCPGPAGGGGPE